MKKINILLISSLFISAYFLLPQLPAKIPMHWNIKGEVDEFWTKVPAVWFIPGMTLVMFVLFQILPTLDPNKNKYKLFKREWEIIQTGFMGFFTYLQFIILYSSLNPNVNMMPLMFIGLGALFILLGNYLSKIRQNFFLGIKVPWTLASEDNWNQTHRFASWCFVIVGIITLAESFFIWNAPFIIFGGILLASFLPIIYSFLLFKKSENKMKYVYLFLFIILGIIFFIRTISGEDDWICNNGMWVKHGNPVAPMPIGRCK